MDDPDYEEPLLIVGQATGKSGQAAQPSKFAGMSKEEKLEAVKKMQADARAKMQAEEAKNKAENAKAWAEA